MMSVGDYGDKFYIILKGKVSVLIPNYVKQFNMTRKS
jgi:hypothetical protein